MPDSQGRNSIHPTNSQPIGFELETLSLIPHEEFKKMRRASPLEVPQRTSPSTPRNARQLKTSGTDPDHASSPASRTPKDRSPKVVDRRSPRSPAAEKKRPGKVSELESQLAQMQEELKKAKDQLNQSESCKRRAQQEAEEAKKQLATMAEKLEDSEQQLLELSASEESRVQELRKISQDRDRAWESELEAIQKHHSMDSAALASAMNEIQKLKIQLEKVAEAEAVQARHAESAHHEIETLKAELSETLTLVEKLKTQVNEHKESEMKALEAVSSTQMQLELAKKNEETLRSENLEALEAYKSLATELEASKAQVNSLEGLVSKLEANNNSDAVEVEEEKGNIESEETAQLKADLNQTKSEIEQLRFALEAAERRYQEEYIQSTLQIRSAYELVEKTKTEYSHQGAALEAKLESAKSDVEDLNMKLLEKDTELRKVSQENEELNIKLEKIQSTEKDHSEPDMELKKLEADFAVMRSIMFDKEAELKGLAEENEKLKAEIKEKELEGARVNDEAAALAEAAKVNEREALLKVSHLAEEVDKSNRKAARAIEELDAAQAANSEMEAELRKLKVQSDQWRKAAEAAAAMLSTGNHNGKFVERTGSLDSHTLGGKLNSPYSEDMEDESPKKKNGNMLKKIGVLLKKGQR